MKQLLKPVYSIDNMMFSEPDFLNLPLEIIDSDSLCLWKYGEPVNGKAPKIPYRYNAYTKKLLKGMGDFKSNLLFSYDHFVTLKSFGVISNAFSLGLSLPSSSLSVIDIDNYQSHPILDRIILSLCQKGCYIEVSPSGTGLHIFYRGYLDWSNGRNHGVKTLTGRNKDLNTSCEVYSFYDRRFITLTGFSLKCSDVSESGIMPEATEIENDLKKLGMLFFSPREDVLSNDPIDMPLLDYSQSIWRTDEKTVGRLAPILSNLLGQINKSRYAAKFSSLSSYMRPEKYSSTSEADMAFCGICACFVDKKMPKDDQVRLVYMAFVSHRFKRAKSHERPDYLVKTIIKALNNASSSFLPEESVGKVFDKKRDKNQSPKTSIIKVCNAMKIFHFGRPFKDYSYTSTQEGNELIVHMPKSLNQVDFRYFAELLFQYIDIVKDASESRDPNQLKKDMLVVNIKKLFKAMNTTSGGRKYELLLASLNKLSHVTMQYKKIIDKDKKIVHKGGGSLITFLYEKRGSIKESAGKHQLVVKMHPIVIDMVFNAQYNYALLNKDSYYSLKSDKAKLLYYHFCTATLPGSHAVTFSLDSLLNLWPKSLDKRAVRLRRKELTSLLTSFMDQVERGDIKDLYIKSAYDSQENLTGVMVKKQRLQLT